jgi:hypothetical protein
LGEAAELASDLGLEDDPDGNTLSVQNFGGEDGFDGVPDGVAEVDEVSKTGLALINGDDVGFDIDGAGDDGEEELLSSGSGRGLSTSKGGCCRAGRDGRGDFGSVRFQFRKVVFDPDRSSLARKERVDRVRVSFCSRTMA